MKTKLHHFFVTALLIFCFVFHSIDVKSQKVTTNDWITVNNKIWPPVDGTAKTTPFYLAYAGDSRHTTFGFNPDHFITKNENGEKRILLTKPSLSFRYWTNIDTGMFRSNGLNSSKHLLEETFKWANARLENISPQEWASLKLYEYDNFSLALKDVRIEVTEQSKASKQPSSPIHSYRSSDTLSKTVVKDSTPKSFLTINSTVATFTIDDDTLKKFKTSDENFIQFELFAIPNDNSDISSTVIKITSKEKNKCKLETNKNVKKLEDIVKVECTTKEVTDANASKEIINTFKLTLKREKFNSFVIIPKQPTSVKLTVDNSSTFGEAYKMNASKNLNNFVSIIDSQPENASQDMCYALIQIDNELNSSKNKPVNFDLYLTYPNAPSGIHLDKITESKKSFCLNDYIGFRLLKNYQLTLSVEADSQPKKTLPSTPFRFFLAKRSVISTIKLLTPGQTGSNVPFTNNWYYSNRAFNYQIKGPLNKKGEQPSFSACDITGNCFLYTPKKINDNRFQYNLEPVYLNELTKSPFLRIKSDSGSVTQTLFKFGYDKIKGFNLETLSSTFQHFKDLNSQFDKHSTSSTSETHIEIHTDLNSTINYDFHIPICSLDLRVNHLLFKLQSDSSENASTFGFKTLIFNNTKTKKVNDFTQYFKFKFLNETIAEEPEKTNISSLEEVAVSTMDFFHFDSFETDATIDGHFTLTVSAVTNAEQKKADVKMTIKLQDVTTEQSGGGNNLKLKSLPFSFGKKPNYRLLNTVETPRVSLSSGATRLKGARSGQVRQPLPQHRIKLNYDKHGIAISASDIQINRIVRSQGTIDRVDVSTLLKIDQDSSKAAFEESNVPILVNGGFFELIYEMVLASNCSNEIEVSIEYFEVSTPATDTTIEGPIIGTINPMLDGFDISCPYLFEKVTAENKAFCQLSLAYYQTSTTCSEDSGCSNIFSTPLPTSSVYFDANFEKAAKNRYYPNRLTMNSKNLDSQYLHVSLDRAAVNTTHTDDADYCLQFSYVSSKVDQSAIWASTDLKSPFSIDFPANSKGRQQNRIICQSWFSQKFASVNELYFRFDNSLDANSLIDLDKNYIEISPVPKWGADVVAFESGITRVKEVGQVDWSKLFIDVPAEFASNFKLDAYGTIEYSIADLQSLKGNSSLKLISSKLRTRWIRSMGKLRDELYLTALPSGDAFNQNFLTVSLTVSSSTDGPIYRLPNLNNQFFANASQQPIQLNLNQSVNIYYQLTFDFQVDLTKVGNKQSASLKLVNISVNDACSSQHVKLENGHPCNAHGSCVTANYHAYTATCHCDAGFAGDACSTIDYCTALNTETKQPNEQSCRNAKCISSLKEKTFICQCLNANETWNAAAGSCLKATFEECGENEVRQLSADRSSSTCVCRSGFVRLKSANNKEVCTAYDVCKEEHRAANKESLVKPCADTNAECKKKQSGDEYECICKAEFYNKFEIKNNKAQCVAEVCKTCDQQCNYDGSAKKYICACETGYTLYPGTGKCIAGSTIDPSKCQSNQTNSELPPAFLKSGLCVCPKDFRFNSTTNLCEIDQALAGKFGCSKVELKTQVDHQPGCVCLEGQQFDPATRKCLPQCTEEKTKECDAKAAKCQVTGDTIQCQCASGFVLLAETADSLDKATCVDKCQLLEKYSQYSASKCVGQFQRCDSEKVVVDASKLIDKKTFLVGNSTVTSLPSNHCSCDFGFEPTAKNNQCTISSVPVKFIRDIPFEVPLSISAEDEKKAYASSTIRPAFIALISTLFKSVVREQSTCQLNSPNEVLCTAAISTKLGSKQIADKLSSSCVYSNDNKTCNYFTEENYQLLTTFSSLAAATPKKLINVLSRDATKAIKVESIDYCASPDRCSSHPDSHCKRAVVKEGNEENAYFECLCEPTFFTASASQTLLTTSTGRALQLQSCRQRDLCFEQKDQYGCADPTAVCSLVVVDLKNGHYSANTFCTCSSESNSFVLPNRNQSCNSACNGRCQNNGTCAVDLYDARKVLCHCIDGFEGEKCEKKVETPQSGGVSSGYRTATIVLSVFFSLGLIALVFVAIKAFTGFNVVYYVRQLIRREN